MEIGAYEVSYKDRGGKGTGGALLVSPLPDKDRHPRRAIVVCVALANTLLHLYTGPVIVGTCSCGGGQVNIFGTRLPWI